MPISIVVQPYFPGRLSLVLSIVFVLLLLFQNCGKGLGSFATESIEQTGNSSSENNNYNHDDSSANDSSNPINTQVETGLFSLVATNGFHLSLRLKIDGISDLCRYSASDIRTNLPMCQQCLSNQLSNDSVKPDCKPSNVSSLATLTSGDEWENEDNLYDIETVKLNLNGKNESYFAAVGGIHSSRLNYSKDGVNWIDYSFHKASLGVSSDYFRVHTISQNLTDKNNPGMIYTAGLSGRINMSNDGVIFTDTNVTENKGHVRGIAIGNDHLVAVGNMRDYAFDSSTFLDKASAYIVRSFLQPNQLFSISSSSIDYHQGTSNQDPSLIPFLWDVKYSSNFFYAVGMKGMFAAFDKNAMLLKYYNLDTSQCAPTFSAKAAAKYNSSWLGNKEGAAVYMIDYKQTGQSPSYYFMNNPMNGSVIPNTNRVVTANKCGVYSMPIPADISLTSEKSWQFFPFQFQNDLCSSQNANNCQFPPKQPSQILAYGGGYYIGVHNTEAGSYILKNKNKDNIAEWEILNIKATDGLYVLVPFWMTKGVYMSDDF